MLMDFTKDLLAHTHSLGLFEQVRVFNEDGKTKIETMTDEKNVIVYGTYTGEFKEFEKEAGMSRLNILSGYANFSPFSSQTAKVDVKMRADGSAEEIVFDSGTGHKGNYRLMSAIALQDFKAPRLKNITWDVTIEPTKQAIDELKQLSSILGAYEKFFTVTQSGNDIVFSIGKGSSDRTTIPFAKAVSGSLSGQMEYPLKEFLSILKLADSDNTVIHFTNIGAIVVEVSNTLSTYQYVFRAQSV